LSDRPDPANVSRVGVVGAGVIGAGWALHYLRMGMDVRVYDPSPAAREALPGTVEALWPTAVELGLREGASPGRVETVDTVEAVAAGAALIQEAAPEVLDMKVRVFAELDACAATETVIATSTSGLSISDIQADCEHPERTVAGHPFNPPYLAPLVEVVGGKRTDPATVDWAVAFYTHCDKYAMRLENEVPAFVASRLQEALWREALHMIEQGEATVEQIDASITEGPGLRWAITGPMMNAHLAGGEGGIDHVLDHFAPTLKEPWTRLVAPEFTDELKARVVEGCEREAAGHAVAELIAERDRCLIRLLETRAECRRALEAYLNEESRP
jgi:carnitine 3-dehydrogenase